MRCVCANVPAKCGRSPCPSLKTTRVSYSGRLPRYDLCHGWLEWARILACFTGTVDQELLLRNEYVVAENRILKAQVEVRLLLSDAEKKTLAEIAHRLGRKALEDVANAAKPDTILGWYRKRGLQCLI